MARATSPRCTYKGNLSEDTSVRLVSCRSSSKGFNMQTSSLGSPYLIESDNSKLRAERQSHRASMQQQQPVGT